MNLGEQMRKSLNRLAKWRSTFAGWQLGTRGEEDPECQAVRDGVEARLLIRTEMNALVGLLLEKKIISIEEWCSRVSIEADEYSRQLELKFPGFKATDIGMSIDIQKARFTMRGWKS